MIKRVVFYVQTLLYPDDDVKRIILRCRKYLIQALLIIATLIQWFLVWKLWIGQRLPDVLGDVNRFAPSCKSFETVSSFHLNAKPTLFQKEPDFNPFNGSDPRWTNLLPNPGGGFVKVPNRQDYPLLPEPVVAPSDGTESFNVAVFHQLHCLHSIAELVEELLPPSSSSSPFSPPAIPVPRRKHVGHCFEYLRLSLRCCGDTTLEGQGKTVEPPGIDGLGSWHICRDFDAISEWTVGVRASDSQELPK
ncbi:hypothetical protein F4861DRAFT_546128 [Xylaria intraflava]|nr:hypothetical protein F4861DRAFT_546128 [Xylaria intraflava]